MVEFVKFKVDNDNLS